MRTVSLAEMSENPFVCVSPNGAAAVYGAKKAILLPSKGKRIILLFSLAQDETAVSKRIDERKTLCKYSKTALPLRAVRLLFVLRRGSISRVLS